MGKKKDIITVFFIGISLGIYAQKVDISMHCEPETAALNQPVQLIVKVEGRPDAVVLPDLEDFKVIAPFGSPVVYSEMRGIADDVEKIEVSTYTALLDPTAAGKFKVDGVSVLNGNKLMKTNPVTIHVENRKISWEDSSAVAQKFTGFVGNNKPYVPTKSVVNYNKTTPGTGVGGNTTNPGTFGRGVDVMEVIPQTAEIQANAGEEFAIVFDVYRETTAGQFQTPVEIIASGELEGLIVLEGPNKRLHSKSNGFRKFTEGTIEYVCTAENAGAYEIPPIKLMHNGITYTSDPVSVIIR